ncbi:MAG: DsrE/DsrF/DrsH-like family protein [Candidatus Odinarchaeia archaeon]
MANKKKKKMSIIVHSGTFDKAFPPFMLAAAAGASDVETHMFFTFWGLNLLKKGGWEKAKLPGMMSIGTGMMKKKIKKAGIPSLPELVKQVMEMGETHIYACAATMEIMGIKKEDLIPEVEKVLGAAAFLDISLDADITLFI